jgi:4-aminobutyrate aminotransferase/(S)-3-amino-2-methylpropionate transaminase
LPQGTELCKIICLPGSVHVTHTLRAASTLVAGEPRGPTVKTDIPGPKSRQLLAELSAIQVNGSFTHLQFESELIKNHV